MSRSWIIMSRKIPPETSRYALGGGPGSREVIETISRLPTAPASSSLFNRLKLGSKRRLNPTKNGTPARSTSAIARSTRSRSRSMGFSQKIAFLFSVPDDELDVRVRGRCDDHRPDGGVVQ